MCTFTSKAQLRTSNKADLLARSRCDIVYISKERCLSQQSLSEARSPATKPIFLEQLRDALFNIGFLYIKNTGIDQDLYDRVCEQGRSFFSVPDEEKARIDMINQKSFLGYARVRLNSRRIRKYVKADRFQARCRGHRQKTRLARAGRI